LLLLTNAAAAANTTAALLLPLLPLQVTNFFGLASHAPGPAVVGFFMEQSKKYMLKDAYGEDSVAAFAQAVIDGTAPVSYSTACIQAVHALCACLFTCHFSMCACCHLTRVCTWVHLLLLLLLLLLPLLLAWRWLLQPG
jgi:hypothetical protein